MPSSKRYFEFVSDCLSDMRDISYKRMMGEYIIYYRGKTVGGIYDDRFLVKQTAASKCLMPDAPLESPYQGAKPMILVENIEDRDFLKCLFDKIYEELPWPKKK